MKGTNLMFFISLSAVLFYNCTGYGINPKNSKISSLTNTCLDENAWDSILTKHSITDSVDDIFIQKASSMNSLPFSGHLLYFDESPREIISVSETYYFIRYIFNPEISDKTLDGLSPELSEKEKKRIQKRVIEEIMIFQCDKGKKESRELIRRENI